MAEMKIMISAANLSFNIHYLKEKKQQQQQEIKKTVKCYWISVEGLCIIRAVRFKPIVFSVNITNIDIVFIIKIDLQIKVINPIWRIPLFIVRDVHVLIASIQWCVEWFAANFKLWFTRGSFSDFHGNNTCESIPFKCLANVDQVTDVIWWLISD